MTLGSELLESGEPIFNASHNVRLVFEFVYEIAQIAEMVVQVVCPDVKSRHLAIVREVSLERRKELRQVRRLRDEPQRVELLAHEY